MNYTILIYEAAASFALRDDPARRDEYWARWPRYKKALEKAGVFVGGAGLQPPKAATTLRRRAGEPVVQDGPFADTKEQLAGYFVIDTTTSTRSCTGLLGAPWSRTTSSRCVPTSCPSRELQRRTGSQCGRRTRRPPFLRATARVPDRAHA